MPVLDIILAIQQVARRRRYLCCNLSSSSSRFADVRAIATRSTHRHTYLEATYQASRWRVRRSQRVVAIANPTWRRPQKLYVLVVKYSLTISIDELYNRRPLALTCSATSACSNHRKAFWSRQIKTLLEVYQDLTHWGANIRTSSILKHKRLRTTRSDVTYASIASIATQTLACDFALACAHKHQRIDLLHINNSIRTHHTIWRDLTARLEDLNWLRESQWSSQQRQGKATSSLHRLWRDWAFKKRWTLNSLNFNEKRPLMKILQLTSIKVKVKRLSTIVFKLISRMSLRTTWIWINRWKHSRILF